MYLLSVENFYFYPFIERRNYHSPQFQIKSHHAKLTLICYVTVSKQI